MKSNNKRIYFLMVLFLVMFGFKTIVLGATNETLECSAWQNVQKDFQYIFDFCKIVIPLLIIGLSVFDFIKAVAGKDAKDLKKAGTRLMKRLALAIVFFFLPILLEFLLNNLFGANVDICVE